MSSLKRNSRGPLSLRKRPEPGENRTPDPLVRRTPGVLYLLPLQQVIWPASPNFSRGRAGVTPRMLSTLRLCAWWLRLARDPRQNWSRPSHLLRSAPCQLTRSETAAARADRVGAGAILPRWRFWSPDKPDSPHRLEALHGWCVPDNKPAADNKQDAERAWAKLLALYKEAL